MCGFGRRASAAETTTQCAFDKCNRFGGQDSMDVPLSGCASNDRLEHVAFN
jgi:hypothetical protein